MDRSKLKLTLILAAVILPLSLATISYNFLQSRGGIATTNNGKLIIPVLDITDFAMLDEQGMPAFQSFEELIAGVDAEDYEPAPWRLIFLGSHSCDQVCGDRLFYLRQLHRLLGSDEDRVARLYVNVSAGSEDGRSLDEQTLQMFQEAFSMMRVVYSDGEALSTALSSLLPEGADPVSEHYIFVADPLGNVMLYFTPENTPDEILEDLEKLLARSSLG